MFSSAGIIVVAENINEERLWFYVECDEELFWNRLWQSLAQTGCTLFNLLCLRAHLSASMNMATFDCSLWGAGSDAHVKRFATVLHWTLSITCHLHLSKDYAKNIQHTSIWILWSIFVHHIVALIITVHGIYHPWCLSCFITVCIYRTVFYYLIPKRREREAKETTLAFIACTDDLNETWHVWFKWSLFFCQNDGQHLQSDVNVLNSVWRK